MKTKMKQLLTSGFGVKLLVFFGLGLGLTTATTAWAATPDENGITPYTWITFDELAVVDPIATSGSAVNSGSCANTFPLTAGKNEAIVANDKGGKAWRIGSASVNGSLAASDSAHPSTYIVRVSFNGQTISNERVIWACNGQAYGGPSLTVQGGGTSDYTVRVRKCSGKNIQSTEIMSCTISKDDTGYHWFALTTVGNTMDASVFYLDGVIQTRTTLTTAWRGSNQNGYFTFGKTGGNGNDSIPTGILYDDIRMYSQVLSAGQIANIAGAVASGYDKFINNPGVVTWAGASGKQFTDGTWYIFSIATGADTETTVVGSTATKVFPCYEGTSITPWHAFCTASSFNKYKAPGYVLRFSSDKGQANKALDARYSPAAFGGMIVETGATGFSFAGSGSGRNVELGDNTGSLDDWFIYKESFTFDRNGTCTLYGPVNFDIASGATVVLNANRSTSSQLPVLANNKSTQLKMHGEGTLSVGTLTATGNVTLDYTDLATRTANTPYISGTVVIDDSTVIKLPATLQPSTPFPMATALTGANDGIRTIYLGNEQVQKVVAFSNGSITYTDISAHKTTLASGTTDKNWTDITWQPNKPQGGFVSASVELVITNEAAAAAVTIDENTTAAKLEVVSGSGTGVAFSKGDGKTVTIADYDFSEAAGAVTIFDTGSTPVTLADGVVITQTGSTLTKTAANAITVNDGSTITVTAGSPTIDGSTVTSLSAVGHVVNFTGNNTVNGYTLGNNSTTEFKVKSGTTTFAAFSESSGKFHPKFTVDTGATMVFPSYNANWGNADLTVNGNMTVNGQMQMSTGDNQSYVRGSGTLTCSTFSAANVGHYHLECSTVTLGGFSVANDTCTLNFGNNVTLVASQDFTFAAGQTVTLDGALTFDTAGHTVTINGTLTGNSGKVGKTGNGTLVLGTARPHFTSIGAGVVQLKALDADMVSGTITLAYDGDTAPTTANFSLLKADGTAAEWADTDPITLADNVLTLKFKVNEPITSSTTLSEAQAGKTGILTVVGTEQAPVTLTIDTTVSADITQIMLGNYVTVKLAASGEGVPSAIPVAKLVIESGCAVTFENPTDGAFTVPANTTLTIVGGADAAVTYAQAFAVNGTLKTKGKVNYSATSGATVSGTLEVVDGELTYAGSGQGITGTLTVDAGSVFTETVGDAFTYGGTPTLNIYGTANFGGTRQSFKEGTTINLYTGCTVNGTGDGQKCTFDFFDGQNGTINVIKTGSSSVAKINCPIRIVKSGKTLTFNVASTAHLECHGAIIGGGNVSKTSNGNNGTLAFYGANTYMGTTTLETNKGYLTYMPGSSTTTSSITVGSALELGGTSFSSTLSAGTSAEVVLTCPVTNNGRIDAFGDAKISGTYSGNGTIFTGKTGATANSTLTLVGNNTTIGGAVTLNDNVKSTLRLEGTGAINNLTVNAKGTLLIAGDSAAWTSTAATAKYMGGLTIASGATYTIQNNADDGNNTTFNLNVYGTLVLNSRFCPKGGSTLNFYAGSTLSGTGDGTYGAMDGYGADCTYNFLDDDDDPTTLGTITITAPFRCRKHQVSVHTFNVAEGVTVDFQGYFPHQNNNDTQEPAAQSIVKTGLGTIKLSTSAKMFKENFSVNAGTLVCEVQPFKDTTKTLTIASGATLDVSGWTSASIANLTLNAGATVKPCAGGLTVSSTLTSSGSYHINGAAVLVDPAQTYTLIAAQSAPTVTGVTATDASGNPWLVSADGNAVKATKPADATWNAETGKWEVGGVEVTDFSKVNLRFTAGDNVTFTGATTPFSMTLPDSGVVTVNGYHYLGVPGVTIPGATTLKVVFPDVAAADVPAITNVFAGAGTLELALATTGKYATSLPIAAANFGDGFTGGVKFSAGQFKATTALKDSIPITVVDGAQLFIPSDCSGSWGNAFTISGNGYGGSSAWDRLALRFEKAFGSTATITTAAEGSYATPVIGTYFGNVQVGNTISGVGVRIYNYATDDNHMLIFTAPKTQFSGLNGPVEILNGIVKYGNSTSSGAGDYVFGTSLKIDSGAELRLWLAQNDTRGFTTPITMNGGTLKSQDGKYTFSSVTIAAASTISMAYGKTFTFTELNGSANLTLTQYQSEANGSFVISGGDYSGTITASSTSNTDFKPTGTALDDATVVLNSNMKLVTDNTTVIKIVKMGVHSCLKNNAVTINAGTTLDVNNVSGTDFALTLNGGTLVNTASSAISHNSRMMGSLTLTAASTVNLNGNNYGLISSGWGETSMTMNGHTLTKQGSGDFYLVGTTINGEGTIDVRAGALSLPNRGDYNCSFANGTIALNGGTLSIDSKTLSLKGLTVNGGTINNTGTLTGLAVLNGTVDFNNIGGTVGFANAVTVASGTTTLSSAASTALAGKTVTVNGTLDCGTYRPTLTLDSASTGTVIVKLTDDTDFNAGTAIPLFTVSDGTSFAGTIRVFDSKGSERKIKALAFENNKVVIQRSEDDKLPPFSATAVDEKNWTAAGWMDSSASPKAVVSSDWDVTVVANLAVAQDTSAALTLDRSISLSTLNITNAGTLAIADAGDFTLTATTIDDSASTGATTLNFALGTANVTAGANTTIAKGGTTGTLTVGADKKATLENGAAMGPYSVAAGGWVRFNGDYTGEPKLTTDNAIFSYNKATLNGTIGDAWILRAESHGEDPSDAVTIDGNNYKAAMDVCGGTVTLTNSDNISVIQYGGLNVTDKTNSVIRITNGGTVIAGTTGTDTGATTCGFLLGTTQNKGNTIPTVEIDNGTFDVSTGCFSFWQYSQVTILNGTLKAKGVQKLAANASSITIGAGGVLELGSEGFKATTGGDMTATLAGGKIRSVADNTVSQALAVSAASTLSAAAGKTMTVTGALSGSGAITIGTDEDTGAVKFASTDVMGSTAITVNDAATIKVGITDHQYASGLTLSNVTLGEGRNITFVLPNGTEVQGSGNTINVSHYWYEFNGNTTASSTASLTLGDASTTASDYVVTSHGQALKTSGTVSPYFGNCDKLTGDWSVITFAKTIQKDGGAIWTLGSKGDGGIALVSDGTDGVKLGKFTSSGFTTTEGEYIAKADIDASNRYHSYAAVKSGSKLALYVDGVKIGEIDYTATLENQKGQFGGVHGGLASMRADGTCIDDWKLFKMAVSEVYLAGVARDFSPWPCDTISISFKDNDGTAANNVQVADNLYAGVHPIIGTSWNNLVGQHGSGANFTKLTTGLTERLIDGTTLASTAAATISGNCTYYAAGGTHVSGNGQMTFNYIDDGANPNDSTKGAGVKVEAIPYAEYTLYIYMGSDSTKADKKFRPVEVLTNGVAVAGLPTENWGRLMSAKEVDNALTLVENENYLKVEGLTAETIQIWGSKGSDNNRCGIAAVQIVRTGARRPTPAPFTAVISASGDWANGAGENLTEKSGTWTDSYLRSIILTNTLASGYLNFDSNVKAAGLTIVGGADKTIDLTVAQNMTPHFSAFDFSETLGAVTNRVATGTASVAAGADTVLTQAGSGTLTIGTGKQATIPGWTDAATKITGAGDLVVDTGAKATEFQVASFAYTGKFTLKRGTWNAATAFPQDRANLFFDGENALMKVSGGDKTGHSRTLPKIEFMNGATLQFLERDTFSRELVLRNGSHLVVNAHNTGRGLDFYENAKLSVYGSGTTSTIGGTTAGTIENSGVISIRRDMEVLVDEGATLDVWSQWGFNSEANALTRAVTKKGAGTVIFHRPSPQTGKFTVSAGTLKLVDLGTPTTGEFALSSGTTLELNASADFEQVVANTITGEGAIKKTGAGTTKLTGDNAFTGGTTIEAGVLFANHVALGTGTITIADGAALKVDLDDYATVVETTDKIFNFSGDLKEGQLIVLNQEKYPWIKISTSGTDLGKVVVEKAKIPFTGLHIWRMMPKATSKLVDRDPNGRTAGWIDVVNYGPTVTNLANYKIVRSNLGKKVKVTGDDAIAPLLNKEMAVGDVFRVYTSEDYETAEDYGGAGTEVAWFKTVEGVVTKLNAYEEGAIMVVPQKVNPKKYPMVRLYSFVDDENYSVIDEAIVPCDLDDNLEIEFVANTNKIERNIVYTDGTKVAYGPDVSQLYGAKIDDKVYPIGDLALLKPTGFAAVDTPYEVGFPVNPFMTDGKALDANKIDSVKLVYRVFDPDNAMTEEEVAMSAKELSGDDKKVYGTLWTNAIPSSVMAAANKGKLVQFRAKITDKGGQTFYAPRNANPDVGYEWYGVVIQPEVAETVSSAELTSTAVCTNRLQTFLMFVCGESKTQMDKDIDSQDRTKVPYGARIAVYDTQTHTYYDNVRIDLRGQTSADFLKKSHGLRFSKVAPLTCVDPFTGDECAFRKTSFIAEYGDPAFIRQTLALRVMRESGVKAPFDYPVRLYLNGTFYQLAFHSNRFTDEIVEDYYGLNPYGYAFKNVHQLTQNSGAEKKTPDDDNEGDLTVLNQYAARIESQTPAAGALTTDAIRHFNIPAWVNYLAAVRVTQEADDVWTNLGIYINKYEYFHNKNGDDTMMPLAYDQNLSFGMWYRGDDGKRWDRGDKFIVVTNDTMKSHPLYGGKDIRYHKINDKGQEEQFGGYNRGMEVILQDATFREMLVRRIRTLAEKYLGGPTTAQADTELWKWISEYKTAIEPDVAADHAKWDYAHIGEDRAHCNAIWIWPAGSSAPSFTDGINELWDTYITQRRIHLYDYHAAKNVGTEGHPTEIGYATEKSAGIPETQAATETFGKHGALYFTDLNGNKPGAAGFDITTDKILGIVNTNNVAIDMSDWTVEGAVVATLKPGTVIPTNSVLWIVEDRPAAAESIITKGIENPVVINLDKTLVDKKGKRLEYFDAKATDQLILKDADGTPAITHEATIGTKYYITLLDAFNCAETNDIVALLTDINNQTPAAVKTSVILYGDTNTLTGAGFDVADGATLTIASGQIANGALGASPTVGKIVLIGGKYTEDSKTAYTDIVSNQYHMAELGLHEGDYAYQVVPGEAAAEGEIILPVAQVDTSSVTNDTGVLSFTTNWLVTAGLAEVKDFKDEAGKKKVVDNLNARQTNHIQAWENAVLGLDGSVEANIPVILPKQTKDATKVTFKMADQDKVSTDSGAIVTYKVWMGSTPKGKDKGSSEAVLYTEDTAMPLPKDGVQYYMLEVITTPAK